MLAVVVVKPEGTKFLKVALPDRVLCQPHVIQFQSCSIIGRVSALTEGGLLMTKMA